MTGIQKSTEYTGKRHTGLRETASKIIATNKKKHKYQEKIRTRNRSII